MALFLIGLNYKTAPLPIREKMAFRELEIPNILKAIKEKFPQFEVVLLSTCNRIEIYLSSQNLNEELEPIISFICDYKQINLLEVKKFLYIYREREVVYHIFSVASSIDSLIVGEAEILGQVKKAYDIALEEKTTGKILNALFQKSINVGKSVRSNTKIGEGKISTSSVAIDFASKLFQQLEDKSVLVIGAGKISEITLRHLIKKRIQKILIINRTYEKTLYLAEKFKGIPLRWEFLHEGLLSADIVVSSTSSSNCIIQRDLIKKIMLQRRNRPIFMIDLAIPRDIEPSVQDIDGVYLYNIDDLKNVAEENKNERQREIVECETYITQETESFISWLTMLNITPIFEKIDENIEKIKKEELNRLFHKLPSLSEKEKEEISYAIERVVNKIFHSPKIKIKEHITKNDGELYLKIFKDIFN